MKKITLLFAIMLITFMANAVSITKQYAVTDIATLQADIASGAADIYELTTAGGNYQLTTTVAAGFVLTKSITIQAASNLYAKPIISVSYNSNSSTASLFTTGTNSISFTFQGIEFNGANAFPNATGQTLLLLSTGINNNLSVSNCYIHNFLNSSGNGTFRFDGTSTTQTINIQNSTFNACGGKMININAGATSTTSVTLINNTFSNNGIALGSGPNANVIYNNKADLGTITVNHCTFYNITIDSKGILRQASGSGAVTINNSIFLVATPGGVLSSYLPSSVNFNNNYLASFTTLPTGATATQATTPTFQSPLTLDFTLTNKASFTASDATLGIGDMSYYPTLPALPAPSQPNAASSIGVVNFTAGWTPVSGASGYTVYVYNQAGTLLITSLTVGGQATNLAVVGGLAGNTTYYYTVKALSDGTVASNSVESPISATFTTNPIVVLTVPTLGTASSINSESFVANWTPVSNASSYTIKVYDATPTLKATVTIPGTNAGSACITGGATPLILNTTYTYTVTAIGDGVSFSNSAESPKSTSFTTLSTYPAAINTNFGDGTWGTAVTTAGIFSSNSINGFDLATATLYANTYKGNKGEVHTNSITLDKSANGGALVFPTVNYIQELEIHASMGSADRTFTVMQSVLSAGVWSVWNAVGTTYNYSTASKSSGLDSIYVITAVSSSPTKFKIINGSTGSMYITQIITRTTTSLPSINRPSGTLTTTPNLNTSSGGFTAIWPNIVAANVSGYKVDVYSSKLKTLVTSATVLDPAALSLSVTGLQADSIYTYGVVALSNNYSQYLDSYMWSAIASGATSALTFTTNLAAPVENSATNIISTGFTANWTPVNNASNYDVNVYQGTTLVENVNATPGTASSIAVNGLNPNTNYTYTVTARGDGSTHFDSAPSAPVAVTTALGTGLNKSSENLFVISTGKTIISSETGSMEVYNLQGAKVAQVQNTNKVNTNLASGLYMVKFTGTNGQMNNFKVIIK